MTKLTKRQSEILGLIKDRIEITGAPPTRAEIAQFMGFRSPNAAEDHLKALAKKGVIELIPGTSRGIRLINDHPGLPIIGRVAAGQPILATQNVEGNYRMDNAIFNSKPDFLLKVCGDSMRDAGILDGDLLAVESTPEARNGQIVVARIEDEVTVKRFFRNGPIVILQAENPEYQAIKVDLAKSNVTIEGIGVGVIRNLSNESSL